VQLFQRRRWVDPSRLAEGFESFVDQLAWIDAHTDLSMAGWRRTDPEGGPGAILATTTYADHGWFLAQVARLQALDGYAPVNDATAALTVGTDAFERWDAPGGLDDGWALPDAAFRQVLGPPAAAGAHSVWTNAEGAEGLVAWFPDDDVPAAAGRWEAWVRIH